MTDGCLALAPDLSAVVKLLGVDETTVRKVLAGWGPGKFDATLFLDGKGFRPDGKTSATLIPAAFGLAGVNLHTFTGWGSELIGMPSSQTWKCMGREHSSIRA